MLETPNDNPTHLQDEIVEKQLRDTRDQFIQSIRTDDIRRLAASYHPSQSVGAIISATSFAFLRLRLRLCLHLWEHGTSGLYGSC